MAKNDRSAIDALEGLAFPTRKEPKVAARTAYRVGNPPPDIHVRPDGFDSSFPLHHCLYI
jgi:hypothetical protein